MKPQGTSEKESNGTPGNENVFVEIRKKKLSSVLSIIVDSAEETSELEAKSEDITQEAARRIKGARKYQLRDMEERTVRTRRRKQNGEEAIFEKMTISTIFGKCEFTNSGSTIYPKYIFKASPWLDLMQ